MAKTKTPGMKPVKYPYPKKPNPKKPIKK